MQTQGSLQESSLASLLQTMQTERATGALAVDSANESASLYFLFGHLFHAAGPGGQGEDVVIHALGWNEGNFKFDPRAKLPPEETIKASPSELVAEAERRGPVGAGSAAAASDGGWAGTAGYGGSTPETNQAAGQYDSTYPQAKPGEEYAAAGWGAQPETSGPYTAESAATEPAVADAGGYAPWAAPSVDVPQFEAPAFETAPAPVYDPPQATPNETAQPETYQTPAASYQPQGSTGGIYQAGGGTPTEAPAAVEATTTTTQVMGAPSAAPLEILYPLPSGRSQYEGLKSAFVDFPKLLRTLRGDQHTGYVRLTGPDFSGVLLFHQGQLLQALSSDSHAQTGEQAFQAVRRQMDAGTGTIDVIELSGDVVDALAELLTAPLLYTGLLGRFINFNALLEHLGEEKVEGAVVVVGAEDVGIILLSQGDVLGAYTRGGGNLDTSTAAVAKIAGEKTARIEVKSGTGAVAAIDVETALNRPY